MQVTLVDHSKRRAVLTPVGVETVERARKIVKEVEDLVSFTTASREPLSSALRMGTIPTIGPFLLPHVLPGLRETYRGLKLYLVEDMTDRLIACTTSRVWRGRECCFVQRSVCGRIAARPSAYQRS
jgi:LysR family hydrogen peroxide-inducible transcriptional activator